ncbi:MAG: nitroreductase family protein [Thermodesulfovibrionales bacterium]|nr:nitroreductase family protein [Thermodesulfovibrionales bacterium]
MDLFEAIKTRRSIRRFSDKPVSDENITTILDLVRYSPSWANLQCWRFIVVREKDNIKRISELSYVESFLKPMGYKANPATKAIAEASVVIVLCADPTKSGTIWNQPYYMTDVGIASQTLMLAVRGLGLGTVFVGIFEEDAIRNLLNIPSNIRIVGLFPIGYLLDEKKEMKMPERKPLSEIVFYEKWAD